MECKKPFNLKECTCTVLDCPRRGLCCACVRYHRERDGVPACFFSKKAEAEHDRSTKRFINDKA